MQLEVRGRPAEQPPADSPDAEPAPRTDPKTNTKPEPGSLCHGEEPGTDIVAAEPLALVELTKPADWQGELPAEEVQAVDGLEVFAAAPVLAEGMVDYRDSLRDDERSGGNAGGSDVGSDGDSAAAPTRSDLTWYAYDAIIAIEDGARYLDVEASRQRPTEDDAHTWRARVDLDEETVATVQIDPT